MWKKPANWYILIGAVLFVSSDSLVAFNKFYNFSIELIYYNDHLSDRAVFDCIRYF
jgi:hypothetical protein